MTASCRECAGSGRTGDGERGSALLIVFVFAAILAISLYKEMPIVAFEAQRAKEQILVDRGNEYAHGIKLFVRKTGQYPPSLDALENTNRMRFLRKRYKDPFTGKDDWRLLHSGPGGIIIDSKVNPVTANNANGPNGNNMPGSPTGNSPGNTGFSGGAGANSGPGVGNNPGSANSGFGGFNSGLASNTPNANNPNFSSGSRSQNSGGFGGVNSGANSGGSFGGYLSSLNSNANTDSGSPQPPSGAMMRQRAAAIAANGGSAAAQPGVVPAGINPGMPPSDSSASTSPPNNLGPNSNAQSGPRMQAGFGQNIGNNPQGMNSTQQGMNNQANPFNNRMAPGANTTGALGSPSSSGLGVMQGGMIAGVASKAEGTGIKTVNDQDHYQLWEFVYDATKDAARQVAGALNQTGAQAGAGNPGNTGFGQSAGTAGNSPFGSAGGNNANSGFGNQTNNGFGNPNRSGFGNSNSGFGNSNNGFGNSSNGVGNSCNGFGNSSNGFGNSNPTDSSSNGWFNRS
ncbi:MAG: hypothetical protein ACJ74Y_08770, partial [Bryobacteraceae bacterium]